jgi:two-component system LytT family response regulator
MNPAFRALIIDDEPAARRLLRSMLEKYEWISIEGEASNGEEAIRLVNERRPDLIFLDIEMPDRNGFEVLEWVSYQPNIIFTTAYEHYALKAFESFSIDYLLKPVRPERLHQSLEKLKSFGKSSPMSDVGDLKKMFQSFVSSKKPTAFPIKQGEKIILLRFENISHFQADDKYVFAFTMEGKKYLTDHTLAYLETYLPENFMRVQKSNIINKDKVGEIHKHFNGRFIIIMQDGPQSRIQSGLTYFEKIRAVFHI